MDTNYVYNINVLLS